jgi:hypothetical protein
MFRGAALGKFERTRLERSIPPLKILGGFQNTISGKGDRTTLALQTRQLDARGTNVQAYHLAELQEAPDILKKT